MIVFPGTLKGDMTVCVCVLVSALLQFNAFVTEKDIFHKERTCKSFEMEMDIWASVQYELYNRWNINVSAVPVNVN